MKWYVAVVVCLTLEQVKGISINCCQQAYDYGIGTAHYNQYYYDPSSNTCNKFDYSGVGGNGNCFNDVEACMEACGSGDHYYTGHGSGYHDSPPSYNTPVDGGWCGWSEWSACSCSCGYGTKTRSRSCTKPAPAYGGADCTGSSTDTASCYAGECHYPTDGYWSAWSAWGACNKNGFCIKRRTCHAPSYGGKDCVGHKALKKRCHDKVHGEWGAWCAWSDCTATCDGGTKQRSRKCDNPAPGYGGLDCVGESSQTMVCNTQPCYVNGGWGAWCEWSGCTATCGSGSCHRSRKCDHPYPSGYGAHECSGGDYETTTCSKTPCPTDGGWGAWCEWSACDKTCGGGETHRSRKCNNPVPSYGGQDCSGYGSGWETMACNTQPCYTNGGWGAWCEWSDCSATCGGGVRERSRKCDHPKPAYGGSQCGSNSAETEVCNTDPCYPVVTCPGGGSPHTDQNGQVVYCHQGYGCPKGYTCVDIPYGSYGAGHTVSVCCPYSGYGGNTGGDYHGNDGTNYGSNTGGDYHGNDGTNYGSNTGGDYHGNDGTNYGGNTGGDYHGNDGTNYGGNTGGDYHGNDGTNYGGNTGGDYHGNDGTNYGGNTGGDYHGNSGSDYGNGGNSNVCGLEKDSGTGNSYSLPYYYDTHYKDCYQFAYYGQGGNGNRFLDKISCQRACKGYN